MSYQSAGTARFTELDWTNRCLAYGNGTPSRVAAIHAILAMSNHQLGQSENARFELAQSRKLIDNKFKAGLDPGDAGQGFWFDWVLAQVLEREAINDIEGSPLFSVE